MKTISQTYHINAPVEKVWDALVDPKVIDDWGGGPVEMNDQTGFEFSLWGGDIHGTNLEVKPNHKLVQEWYGGKWDKPSKVTFTLQSKDGKTQLDLLHQDIPDSEAKEIDEGWKKYYLGPLKELVEHL